MIALVAAGILAFGSNCVGGLCVPAELRPYFEKLAHARGRQGKPVHILQIGDSHSAGDSITGGWREALQARYGSGGRGVMPPGRPYDYYISHGVSVTMSGGWSIASDFGRASADPKPPLGLSAFSLTSQYAGATMAIEAEPQERFTRFVVCALARPGAGTLVLHAGEAETRMDLTAPSERPECRTLRTAVPASHADITTEGGTVTVTSWATFADQGGVAVSNLGVIGSQLTHFARTNDMVLTEELRTYQPDLIVIGFGTNEGFAPRFQPFEYELVLRSQIARMRRLAGNVPILLLGAPDALTRRPELKTNAPSGDASACLPTAAIAAANPAATTAPAGGFTGTMARIGDFLGVTSASENGAATPAASPPPPAAANGRLELFPPAGLAAVREVQQRVAASLHVAYWDWAGRMGGRCTALAWARATPPLMSPRDYVHYTRTGGREIARRLQADLDAAAAR